MDNNNIKKNLLFKSVIRNKATTKSILKKTLSDNNLLINEENKENLKNQIFVKRNKSVYKSLIDNKNFHNKKSQKKLIINEEEKKVHIVENWKNYNYNPKEKKCCECSIY